jgi:anthranilate 1,2-dioxygenase ferredoxin subunit
VSASWQAVVREEAFATEGKFAGQVNGWHILVCRTQDGLFAVNDRCPHQATRLSGGRVRNRAVMCPLHGARFDLATGRCMGGSYADLRTFPVRTKGGLIEILIPGTPPGSDEIPISVSFG